MIMLRFDDQVLSVRKITAGELSQAHVETIGQARYEGGALRFPNPRWRSICLGAGEEKACFCVCDEQQRVFVVEAIDERHYLNGRFVGGTYFFERRVSGLAERPFAARALIGLTFTGLVKVREFVHGYEWGRFQWTPQRQRPLDHVLTSLLSGAFAQQFGELRRRYKDVHDRNVLFELRPRGGRGVPVLLRDWGGALRLARVGIQPIDVR